MMIGTRVMVKSWPTIASTLDDVGIWEEAGVLKGNSRMNFGHGMKEYCHKKTRIIQVYENCDGDTVYNLEGCDDWWWHPDWFYDMTHKVLPDSLFKI